MIAATRRSTGASTRASVQADPPADRGRAAPSAAPGDQEAGRGAARRGPATTGKEASGMTPETFGSRFARPRRSASEQLAAATTSAPAQPFQALPAPTGEPPF